MTTRKPSARWRWIGLGGAAAALLAASYLLPLGAWIERFTAWIEDRGPLGPLLFALGYVLGTVAFVPGSLLTLAAGATFGIAGGAALALAGATVGAALAFLIGRSLGRGFFRRHAGRRLAALDDAVGEHDFKVVLLLRLSPVVPFNLSNYLFGLTRARFGAYVLASLVGMAPGAVLYAWLGSAGRAVLTGEARERSALEIGFLVAGLVATGVVTVLLARESRRRLGKTAG